MSDDRWVHPAEGDTSADIDLEHADEETTAIKQTTRHVTHEQEPEGAQGVSSDVPGTNPADRHSPDGGMLTSS